MKLNLFKTRKEVQALRSDIALLNDMLKTHFDIKYTLEDFNKWSEFHPEATSIPVTENELIHFIEMILPYGQHATPDNLKDDVSYRTKPVKVKL